METNQNTSLPPMPPPQTDATTVAYAGFGERLIALLIDGVLLSVVQFVLKMLLLYPSSSNTWTSDQLLPILLSFLYFSLMESSHYQATIGKRVIGIKVTDMAGNRISWLRATGRYFGKFISGIILLIGYLMAAFTEKKQALHDIMAGTVVVKIK